MEDYPETVRALSQSTIQALREEGIIPRRHSYLQLSLAAALILVALTFLYKHVTSADIVIAGFILLLAIILRIVWFIVTCLTEIAFYLIVLAIALTPLFTIYLIVAGFI